MFSLVSVILSIRVSLVPGPFWGVGMPGPRALLAGGVPTPLDMGPEGGGYVWGWDQTQVPQTHSPPGFRVWSHHQTYLYMGPEGMSRGGGYPPLATDT